jgi:formylglycine-generating enzyme required for sulfatase activity
MDGNEMMLIPAGKFMMGSNYHDEQPIHEVELSDFYMSKHPITVSQYRAYCSSTQQEMPPAPDFNKEWSKADHPIVNVSWKDATSYCAWLSKETGQSYSLPTEAEWEYAGRGGLAGKRYPWGDNWNTRKCANSLSGTVSVGRYEPNGYGLFDMAGNVWEWCSDWYAPDYYKVSPLNAPKGPAQGTICVIRGGSWSSENHQDFRCACREWYFPDFGYYLVGFRVVFRGLP